MVEALEQQGIADNTWVIYTSDHGEMLGDHLTLTKMLFYRQALEVPFILVPPKDATPATVDGMVQHLDATATIEAIAGASGLPGAKGFSLLGHTTGDASAPVRDMVVSENYGFGMIANSDFKLVFFEEDKEPVQLFDLRRDPEENNNVLLDPYYIDAREMMVKEYMEPFLATPPVVRSPGYMGLTVTA
jgi:arylsulfatase A-like enzyme